MHKILFILPLMLTFACSSQSKMSLPESNAGPDALIYKTRADYSSYVPVILSADKKTLLSFPHPDDLQYQGKPARPTPLIRGYWLDNRGISQGVAFTSYTYEAYAALSRPPSVNELLSSILDDDPLLELYNCGPRERYTRIGELNQLIRNQFEGARKIK